MATRKEKATDDFMFTKEEQSLVQLVQAFPIELLPLDDRWWDAIKVGGALLLSCEEVRKLVAWYEALKNKTYHLQLEMGGIESLK